MRTEVDWQNAVLSCIMGGAMGDALGVPYEFLSRELMDTFEAIEMCSGGFNDRPTGSWSDDTSMTLATMDSVINKGSIDPEDLMERFKNWLYNAEYTPAGDTFGVGITVRRALENYCMGEPAEKCGLGKFHDNGNGSLMRFAPIALYCFAAKLPRKEEVELVKNASGITHAHEISNLGCLIYTDFVKELLVGKTKEDAYKSICLKEYLKYFSARTVLSYTGILYETLPLQQRDSLRQSGYVVDTLEAALWCVLSSSSYEETVTKAVCLGCDTDTTAIVAGSLAGIIYGYDSLPASWLDKLLRKDYISSMCRSFSSVIAPCG